MSDEATNKSSCAEGHTLAWIKSRTRAPTVICAVHVPMALSAIFQHHHGGVGEGKAAHYRGCIPFSIPASCRSRSVRSDWRGLVSAAAKWSHQSQSRRDGKNSINQLKMMKSESSRLIKASKREITDTQRVVTTQKISLRNDFITCKSTWTTFDVIGVCGRSECAQRRRSRSLRTSAGDGPQRYHTYAGRCFSICSQS